MNVPVIEKHGCLRMLDDLKNGRPRAPIEPEKGWGSKEAQAALLLLLLNSRFIFQL